MTATAVTTTTGEEAITRARVILADDRGFTGPEQQHFRDVMYRLMEAGDRITEATLRAICSEIDKRSLDRIHAAQAAKMAKVYEERRQHKLQRPQRWAALSPLERAAFLVADKFPVEIGNAVLRLAKLAAEDTAGRTPPETFEPEL